MESLKEATMSWRSAVLGALLAPTALGCGLTWKPLFDEEVTERELRTVSIAPLEQALTFARYQAGGSTHVLLVRDYSGGMVRGVDLSLELEPSSSDPITIFEHHGFEAIRDAAGGKELVIPVDQLVAPVDLGDHHIAVGTNFPEHADEAGVEGGPYLFPKLVVPSEARDAVSIHGGLLDYEVELGYVPLDPIGEGDRPPLMGLVLCNDYTDRDALLRHLDPSDVASGDGFTTGKSFPGYLPIGNLFVVPQDFRSFAAQTELRLYVNRRLRQRSSVARAVWDLDEILNQVWNRKDVTWEHRGRRYGLFAGDAPVIAEGTVIMSGTPPGVVFNEVGAENRATAFPDFVFFGWGDSLPDHAIDDYITDARAAGIYLMPDDQVDIHVERLGVISNRIVP